jgi:type I restriction enzyme S subunit
MPLIPEGVQSVPLSECGKWLSGGTPSKQNVDYWGPGLPWVSAKDLKSFRLYDAEDHITTTGAMSGSRVVQPGTILILVRGMTLLQDVPICVSRVPLAFNQDIKAIRPFDHVDADYLAYWLLASKEELLSNVDTASHGTGRLQSETLGKLEVALPGLRTQRAIAAVLAAFDDKIELNRRMNETLEAMARELFRSWFVDFDPVRAKSEGRPTGLPADLDALFPNEFEPSPLGEIPKGWRAGAVSDVAGMGRQQVNPGDSPEEVFAHYSIPAFDAGRNPILEVGFAIKSNKLVVTPGSILVSKLNPHIPRVWLTDVDPVYRAVGSTEFFVLQATAPHSSAFLYALMSSPEFAVDLQTLVTGTSNSHQRVQPEAFLSYSLVVPSDRTAAAFESLVKPLLDQVLANRKEMAQLAKTRDELLPRLLNGEIEVAESEAIVG